MVQEGRGHGAIDVWANGEAALWSVSLVILRPRPSGSYRNGSQSQSHTRHPPRAQAQRDPARGSSHRLQNKSPGARTSG
jgi:hypothetical protein